MTLSIGVAMLFWDANARCFFSQVDMPPLVKVSEN